jgi:hypothetical protein
MDKPWSVICGELDRATGRRFPPIVGGGRGYVMRDLIAVRIEIHGADRVARQLAAASDRLQRIGR